MARKKNIFEEPIIPALADDEYFSKTELKQQAKDIKAMGLAISELSPQQRKKLDLDEELSYALEVADKIRNTREGYRRQLQFIGRLLRARDIDAIALSIHRLNNTNKQDEKALMQLEKVREDLLAQGDTKVNELIAEHPAFERQKLRQLVKKTLKQQQQHPEQTSPAYKELYQYIKEIMK